MFISKDDMSTHIYQEILDEITRGDDSDIEKNITTAIGIAKAYLSRYDLIKLFGTNELQPEVESEMLKNLVKDIASWYLLRKANPNIDLTLFRTAYEDAIASLKDIQKGVSQPEGWPAKPDDPDSPINERSGNVQWSSNRKRSQHL